MITPDSPTLAVMGSLSTSQAMSKIKERKVTLNPTCHTSGRAEPFSTVNSYKYSNSYLLKSFMRLRSIKEREKIPMLLNEKLSLYTLEQQFQEIP